MSLGYTVRESFSGFRRTKLSSVISIITVSISLLLLGIFAVVSINTTRFVEALRDRLEMEAFLREPVTVEQRLALERAVRGVEGVESVDYISKDEAARIFKQEFGEDITQVLDFNPLPPSFKIRLRLTYRTAAAASALSDRVAAIEGIESVRYRKGLLELIDARTKAVHNLSLVLGVLISVSAIFLVSNTIRLAIYAKRKLIRTMELVGATRAFIRSPFLLEGMLQGLLGGLVSSGILYVLIEHTLRLLSPELSGYVQMDRSFYLAVIGSGVGLGFIGSAISVSRFIRPPE
jgi:cell division transport system permease protein